MLSKQLSNEQVNYQNEGDKGDEFHCMYPFVCIPLCSSDVL